MVQSNCMRNLSGCGLATVHRHRGGFLRLEARPCPPDPPRPPDPSDPPDPPAPSALVGPGVLSWLAATLPRVRYKPLPARCFVEQSGTKLSLCGQNTPNWAILGERGEFCTAHAARRGEQGEFCPEAARCGSCWASCVVLWRSPRASRRAMAAPWRCSRTLRSGSPCPRRSPRRWRWGFCAMRSAAGACCRRVAALDGAIPPDWRRRGRGLRWCGHQSADPLGEKSPQPTGLTEWNCTLTDSVSVAVCTLVCEPAIASANPLFRT